MFKRKSPEGRTYQEKVKQYGGCPPCDKCGGSGWTGKDFDGCDPCWSTGIDPGPKVPPRSQFKSRKRR